MNCVNESTRKLLIVGVATLVLLCIQGPLFLYSPLGPDPAMYDLQARVVTDGGVLYQDILEPNLPGAVWVHLAIRSIGGWSSVALRTADLLLFAATALLASSIVFDRKPIDCAMPVAAIRGLFAMLLVGGYLTLSEWCHCQRDVWTLPFVLGAVLLRIRRTELASHRRLGVISSFAEGVLWGAAVWLKPHVALVGAAAIALSWLMQRSSGKSRTNCLAQFAATVCGGLLVGAAGVAWLVQHGAWTHLWITLTAWNPEYLSSSADRWSWGRLWSIQERLFPWSLVHLAAIPLALQCLSRFLRAAVLDRSTDPKNEVTTSSTARVLLASVYLAWVGQTLLLQHLFDYVHVPAIVLGGTLVAASCIPVLDWSASSFTRLALAGTTIILLSAGSSVPKLAAWSVVIREGDSQVVRSALAQLPVPDWQALEEVRGYLASQGVGDRELTAYHTHTVHLYAMLGVRPSTRYVFTETHLRLFPSKAELIQNALEESHQRFVVSSLLEAGLEGSENRNSDSLDGWRRGCPPESLDRFPFNQPVVFRAGPYLVHRVTESTGTVETRFFPLARQ